MAGQSGTLERVGTSHSLRSITDRTVCEDAQFAETDPYDKTGLLGDLAPPW